MELAWSRPGAAARFADRVLTLQSGGLERVVDFSAGAPKTRSMYSRHICKSASLAGEMDR